MMKREEFTSDDWDYIMKTNPKLKREYEQEMAQIEMNPSLAIEVDKKMREIIKEWK